MGITFESNPIVYTCPSCGKGILKHVYEGYDMCPYCGTPFKNKYNFVIPPKETWTQTKHFLGYNIYSFDVTNMRQEDVDELYHVLSVMGYTALMATEAQWTVKNGILHARVSKSIEMDEAERKFVGR